MTDHDELHEALAHYGLVTETAPFRVCSTDFRSRFNQALNRAGIGEEQRDEAELERENHRETIAQLHAADEREHKLRLSRDELRQRIREPEGKLNTETATQ